MSADNGPDEIQTVSALRELLGQNLCAADQLRKHEGLPTGLTALDRFLFWGGLPKGALSLLQGSLGSGATSLWLECASQVIAGEESVAWIHQEVPLSPLSLHHRGLNLDRFVSFQLEQAPDQKLFWLLQELMSSSLFRLIGCDLGSTSKAGYARSRHLKEHQIRKLTAQARQAQIALVFITQERLTTSQKSLASVFSLILNFEKHRLIIERALHRPTPHSFTRSLHYARFTHHTRDRLGLGSDSLPASDSRARVESDSLSLPQIARTSGQRL